MSSPPPSPEVALHLTPTLVAQHGRFRCDRRLRWEMVPLDARGATVPSVPPDRRGTPERPRVGRRPGTGLLTAAGRAWERSRIRRLRRRFGDEAVRGAGTDGDGDARRLPYEDLLALLRDPGPVRWIVQPELRLPDPAAWAERWGWGGLPVSVAPSAPDLLRLRVDRDGRVRVGVVEVKWSRDGTAAHFAQVAFYGLLLEEIRRAEGLEFVVEGRAGWVWTRGAGGPRRFALPAHRHEVERVLREEVPRLAASPPEAADWTFAPGCGACRWLNVCRDEAERTDDLCRIPGVTPTARALLRERGVDTVRGLSRSATRPIFDGCHALEVGKDAILQQARALTYGKAMPHRRPTHRLGEGEGTRLFLCAEPDPVSGRCFALGLRVEREGGRTEEEVWVASRDDAAEERRIVSAWLGRVAAAALSSVDDGASDGNGRRRWGDAALRAYLWDRGGAERLHELLVRHLGDAAARGPLAELVGMLAPGDGAREGTPGAVLRDAVEDLYALPVPFDLDLAGVSAALRPKRDAAPFRPRVDYAWPFSSSVAFERAHDLWRGRTRRTPWGEEGPEETEARIRRTVLDKLAALSSVLRAVREREGGRGRLRLDDGFSPRTDADPPLDDPTLEALRVFVRAEAAISRARTRALHALPWEERARRFECVAGMHLVGRREEDGALTFECDPASRDAKFRVGEFTLVLTNQDDGETLRQADLHAWKRRALSVELTEFDTAADPPRLTVVPSNPKEMAKAEREGWVEPETKVCVLDRADVDFGSDRLVRTLRALDGGAGEAEFVRGLLDGHVPEGWPAPLDPAAGRALLEEADARLPHPVLNPDQRAAWEVAFREAVTVVWGPPGTGKTYLLAWTLLGLAASARAAGRPLRVLVTAATHRAVVNVLARIAACAADAGVSLPLRAVKLRGSGNDADADLAGTPVEVVDDAKLEALLAAADGGEPLVVGGTVWSLWKRMKAAAKGAGDDERPVRSWFDVVVVDEASQVRVPEALLALSAIRADGRAVVCGDDRQLSPILHGRWRDRTGGADPLLFGSAFALFAERFGRRALTESRRMNGALVRWPRRLFYPGLVSARADRRLAVRLGDADPMDGIARDELDRRLLGLLFRPDDAVLLCTYDGVRAAARNPFEARLAARIARLARRVLLDPETGEGFDDAGFAGRGLAVVSPHRAQNAAILAELRAGGLSPAELPVVDTVERIQGGEREMIVVSYAVADREYAEAEAEFLLDPNRFNVSITRPKAKLVVLVSEAVLRALPADEAVLEGAMAVKGYPAHCSHGEETLEVPDPEFGCVAVRVRRRRV